MSVVARLSRERSDGIVDDLWQVYGDFALHFDACAGRSLRPIGDIVAQSLLLPQCFDIVLCAMDDFSFYIEVAALICLHAERIARSIERSGSKLRRNDIDDDDVFIANLRSSDERIVLRAIANDISIVKSF